MSRVLVLGYGNTLRGDDGFGRRVAERLMPLDDARRVRVISSHQLSIDFAEAVADAELVIFVDVAREGTPGNVRSVPVTAAPGNPDAVMTHHLTPQSLLTVSRALYGGSPEAVLVTVTGEAFELSEELSAPVAAELDSVALFVQSLIETHDEQFRLWAPV